MSDRHAFALPGDSAVERPDLPWDLSHLVLSVDLDLDAGTVDGVATWTVAPRRPSPGPLFLDAYVLDVSSVELATGVAAQWTNDGRRVEVRLPEEPCTVTVRYKAAPTRGLHFIRPTDDHPELPRQVWSQGQDQDHHHWFPCLDHPAVRFTQEVEVTVDAGLTVLSNGHEVGRDDVAGGRRTRHRWRFDTPHVTYLLTLVAGDLARIDLPDGPPGVAVYALGPPGQTAELRHNVAETGAMIGFFGDYLNVPYPYEQYAQAVVAEFTFGGMENTTATTLTERTLHPPEVEDDYSSQPLVAHELAHQWFGDLISCRDWPHAWLHEGFATYFDLLWREHHLGRDDLALGLKEEADGYFHEDSKRYRRPIVTQSRNAPIDIFDAHLYNKGAWVVHMLRRRVGEASFRKGLSTYLRRHGRGHVETSDLRRALEDASGLDLRVFFEQWVDRGGHPEIRGTAAWDADEDVVVLELSQNQKTDATTPLFRVDLLVRARAGERTHEETVKLQGKDGKFRIRPGFRPESLAVDPAGDVLMTLRVERPPAWIQAQLRSEPEAAGRWAAAAELAESGHPGAVGDLRRALKEDPFRGVRQASAAALGRIRGDRARDALLDGLSDPHPRVRRAACAALGGFLFDAKAAGALRRLIDEDPAEYVVAAAAEALGRLRVDGAADVLERVAERRSHNEVVARGAVRGLVFCRQERGVSYAIAATDRKRPSMLRWTAAGALGEARVLKDAAREQLEIGLDDRDFRFRYACADALAELGDAKALGPLARRRTVETDARVTRALREAQRALSAEGGAGDKVGRLQDEVEGLKARLGALMDRLDKLEAPRR